MVEFIVMGVKLLSRLISASLYSEEYFHSFKTPKKLCDSVFQISEGLFGVNDEPNQLIELFW